MKFLVFLTLILPGSYAVEDATNHNKTADECVPIIPKFSKYIVSIADLTKFDEKDPQHLHNGHLCTGIIIGPQTILTTASCVERYQIEDIGREKVGVVAGTTTTNGTAQIVSVVAEFYIGIMELAIIILSEKLKFDGIFAQSIDYTQKTAVKPGQICTLVGWARLGRATTVDGKIQIIEKCKFTSTIQYIDMVVLEKDVCDEDISPLPRTFCAGGRTSQIARGGCWFDVGRPLFCDSKFVGLELFAGYCAGKKEPSYFIDIGDYTELIVIHNRLDYASKRSSGQKVFANNICLDILAVIWFLLLYFSKE